MKGIYIKGAFISLVAAALIVGCGGGGGTSTTDTSVTIDSSSLITNGAQPASMVLSSNTLNQEAADTCGPVSVTSNYSISSTSPLKKNVSSNGLTDESRDEVNSHNVITRMKGVVDSKTSSGTDAGLGNVHPLLISYNEQVLGSYEMGDGSADIGDPTHVDGVFVSASLDDGTTWKKYEITNTNTTTGLKSSIDVQWNGSTIAYPAHAQKPKMAIWGNKVVVAWHDKYCPSKNPLDLGDTDIDYFLVNGEQGYIDYEGIVAPNGKTVYQVPFSCVWTSRGVMDTSTGEITWHTPMQLTSGMRDSNHIWIEGSDSGFAIAWQEDTEGLKSGKGAGPGEGWSGATTNHGSDIWYSSIKMDDFLAVVDASATRPESANNFKYPVRITDNDKCTTDDKKPYCQYLCENYGFASLITGNNKEEAVSRCATPYTDMLKNGLQVVLDGDTGASRVALKILKTSAGEDVVVLGYEETKGLSENLIADQDQGSSDTDIELEGKAVYFESFKFDALDSFDPNNPASILNVAMPLVSSGKIVNVKVPEQGTGDMIYENARRLVIGTHVDNSDIGSTGTTFVFLYKQSFDTQGASSDMFVRVNKGFTYDSFTALDGRTVTNVSAQNVQDGVTSQTYAVNWNTDNLDDNTYENANENTFSPRIFLRNNNIYVGFAYTPNDAATQNENMPSNFHIHRYVSGAWQGPQNITQVTKAVKTTVDARFFTTAQGNCGTTGLQADRSNPDVLFLTWGEIDEGTIDGETVRTESDIYFKRSVDNGITWDTDPIKLAARDGIVIEEKEVESLANASGTMFFNAWLQESETQPSELASGTTDEDNIYYGLDSWFGRVDYVEAD